jgi:hypothetical protein
MLIFGNLYEFFIIINKNLNGFLIFLINLIKYLLIIQMFYSDFCILVNLYEISIY